MNSSYISWGVWKLPNLMLSNRVIHPNASNFGEHGYNISNCRHGQKWNKTMIWTNFSNPQYTPKIHACKCFVVFSYRLTSLISFKSYFSGNRAMTRMLRCQWGNPVIMGKFMIRESIMRRHFKQKTLLQRRSHNLWDTFVLTTYHGNMYPPKQASTCSGSPWSSAKSEIFRMGSITPWQYCGADDSKAIVLGVIAWWHGDINP